MRPASRSPQAAAENQDVNKSSQWLVDSDAELHKGEQPLVAEQLSRTRASTIVAARARVVS